MPYYVKLSTDIKGLFGSGGTRTSIINSLTQDGISARHYDVNGKELAFNLANFNELGLQKMGKQILFDSRYAFVLGTDKQARQQIGADLMQYFGDNLDEIALQVPRLNEWLACVTFVEPAAQLPGFGPPTEFQVVACVGSSALQAAQIGWTQEDKPPQLWTPHAEPGPKMIRDIKAFTGRGRWF